MLAHVPIVHADLHNLVLPQYRQTPHRGKCTHLVKLQDERLWAIHCDIRVVVTAACWSAAEQEDCRQDAAAAWNAVNVQTQGRLVLRRGISRREKQIIEQCNYMLVQPDWVASLAAMVVQVKTKGGTG